MALYQPLFPLFGGRNREESSPTLLVVLYFTHLESMSLPYNLELIWVESPGVLYYSLKKDDFPGVDLRRADSNGV